MENDTDLGTNQTPEDLEEDDAVYEEGQSQEGAIEEDEAPLVAEPPQPRTAAELDARRKQAARNMRLNYRTQLERRHAMFAGDPQIHEIMKTVDTYVRRGEIDITRNINAPQRIVGAVLDAMLHYQKEKDDIVHAEQMSQKAEADKWLSRHVKTSNDRHRMENMLETDFFSKIAEKSGRQVADRVRRLKDNPDFILFMHLTGVQPSPSNTMANQITSKSTKYEDVQKQFMEYLPQVAAGKHDPKVLEAFQTRLAQRA